VPPHAALVVVFPKMAHRPEITQDNFEQLLSWLHPCRETAAAKYESIRDRLIRIFSARGCFAAEELADETMDRVIRKSPELAKTYSGDPALFFYGVAKRVLLEFARKPRFEELPRVVTTLVQEDKPDEYADCLDRCLEKLDSNHHRLILRYYEGEKRAKIEQRKKLQFELGTTAEALRVKVLRIRSSLQKCVVNCVRSHTC
jgi:hypothetical protein